MAKKNPLTQTIQERVKKYRYQIARNVVQSFKKDKQRERIMERYRKKLENLVRKYASTVSLKGNYDSSWNDKLVQNKGYYFNIEKRTEKYEDGVTSEIRYGVKDEGDSTSQDKIIAKNVTKPRKPLFNVGEGTDINSETALTDWIVEGHIHPLPPNGKWWVKDDWEKIWYKPQPYFDDLENSSEFQQLQEDFEKEMNELFAEHYKRVVGQWISKIVGGK